MANVSSGYAAMFSLHSTGFNEGEKLDIFTPVWVMIFLLNWSGIMHQLKQFHLR